MSTVPSSITEGNSKIGYLQDDGVHLGSKGYDAWVKEVAGFLKK